MLLLWLSLTTLLNFGQLLVFPCSGAPYLSLAFGLPAFGATVGVPLLVVECLKNKEYSPTRRIVSSLVVAIVGSAVAVGAGVPMLLTHMCP